VFTKEINMKTRMLTTLIVLITIILLSGCNLQGMSPAVPAVEGAELDSPTVDDRAESLSSLGDFVWYDFNMNGIQDPDEPGSPAVDIILYDSSWNNIGSTSTDANGNYLFMSLVPGEYILEFEPPAGYLFSPQDQGSDDAIDSDPNIATGQTDIITLTVGEDNVSLDAGLWEIAGSPDDSDDDETDGEEVEEDETDSDSVASSQRLHGKWIRTAAEVSVGENVAPFQILGTELEFNETDDWMIESTAAYYIEGETDGWACNLAGEYDASIDPEYDDGSGPDVTGIVNFSPGSSLAPWVNECNYTAPSDTIPPGDDHNLISPAEATSSIFHVPIIATPELNFSFVLTDEGDTLIVTVTIPTDIGSVSRTYTYARTE